MTTPIEYIEINSDRFKDQLKDLLRIPSISTLAAHRPDVERAAQWIAADMQHIGLQAVEVIRTYWHPVVYGEWMGAGSNAPTVLVYCHYDVQPADMADGWHTPPFEPVERDGKIYGRGAIDSKSNVVSQLKAVEALLATGSAPVNIKLLFEGDEESASDNMAAFVANYPNKIKSDVVVICDGSMSDREQPDISYGLRGIVTMELEVWGPKQDLHSGHYGGSVHNPIQALAEIITQLHKPDGSVAVPGFYDEVLVVDDDERAELAKALPWLKAEWETVAAAPQQWGEAAYNLHERVGARPTLEINGIRGGFAEDGFKTVLPGKALAKISCRLVNNHQSRAIYERVREFVERITPPTVRSELRWLEGGEPALLDRNSPAFKAAVDAYTQAYGKRPFFTRAGGSIPVTANFQQASDAQIVLLQLGYKGCAAHGPNEHLYLDMWYKGMVITVHFLEALKKGC